MTPLLLALALLVPADALRPATEAEYLRLEADTTVTVYAPAIRLDPPPPASVEEIIRDVWPDHLEGRALRIAWRESRYQPRVYTWCCHGVFQIHRIHLTWLDDHGIRTIEQLYDPMLNVNAAYLLYQRDGWTPWTCCT